MSIDKILEMLGVEKLDESKQTDIKETLQTIIEAKAAEMSVEKVNESLKVEKEKLVEEFEQKFETYKEDVTSKFSNFVDSILEEEMTIPERVMKFARMGELYEDLIDQFKIRLALDEGLLDKEAKIVIKEAKEEITKLRDELNESIGKNLDLEKDARELATNIYLRQKCDGLTESQKTSVMSILENASREEIDKKFDVIIEAVKPSAGPVVEEKVEVVVEEKQTVVEPDVTTQKAMNETVSMMDVWRQMIRENRI